MEERGRAARNLLSNGRAEVFVCTATACPVGPQWGMEAAPIGRSSLEPYIPTVYGYRGQVIPGGLVSYGVDLRW
jgi:hypothetical protein